MTSRRTGGEAPTIFNITYRKSRTFPQIDGHSPKTPRNHPESQITISGVAQTLSRAVQAKSDTVEADSDVAVAFSNVVEANSDIVEAHSGVVEAFSDAAVWYDVTTMLMKIAGKVWKILPKQVRTFVTRRTQVKFTVSAAGIITNDKGEVLLLNHVLRPQSGWGVPGGFLEVFEQPEAAFKREVKEETGLDVTDITIVRLRTLRRHIEIMFVAKGSGEASVKTREITELRWFAIKDMPPEMSLDQQFLIRRTLGYEE